MISPQMFLDLVGAPQAKRFRRGILPMIDLFSGAGGTSTGALMAFTRLGLKAQLCAVNHWDTAIASHELNHGDAIHFCTGVDRIDIRDVLAESDSTGLFALWASPSCVNFSAARGGVPLNVQDRSGAWCVVQHLRRHRAVHLLLENVKQFLDWGPVMNLRDADGIPLFIRKTAKGQWVKCYAPGRTRPLKMSAQRWYRELEKEHGIKPAMIQDPRYKGLYFKKWWRKIQQLGYDLEWRLLNAADYGAPTKRERLIIMGVRRSSGRKIYWPLPTHAEFDIITGAPSEEWIKATSKRLGFTPELLRSRTYLPWRTTRCCIEWNDLGTSVFDRKRPLADKTIDRIAVGFFKYGSAPSIAKFKGTGTANSVDEPLGTVQANGQHYGLINPSVSVILPQQRGGKNELRVTSVDAPIGAITGKGAEALATSLVFGVDGEPNGEPFIVPNFGERPTQIPRTHSIDQPLPAVTSHGAGGLVQPKLEPYLVVTNHGNGPEGDKANHRRARSVDEPMDALTGSRSLAVITGATAEAISADETPFAITDWKSLSTAIKAGVKRAKKQPGYRPLLSIDGRLVRFDALFRMLNWRELSRAQSFPTDYQFTGTDTQKIKMLGNAVPPLLSFAACYSAFGQTSEVPACPMMEMEEMRRAA